MNKKYWIIFLIAVNVILITGVIVYFKIQGKILLPEKVTVVKTEEQSPTTSSDTRKSVFIAHAMTPKEAKNLGVIFDKLSRNNPDFDMAFYDKNRVGYFHDDTRVYWYDSYKNNYEKVDCKKDEFKILDEYSSEIGICNKAVFLAGIKDYRIDGESVSQILGDYYGDKKNTYYKRTFIDKTYDEYKVEFVSVQGNPTEVNQVRNNLLSTSYAEANGKLLYKEKLFEKVDLSSLKKLTGHYYTDKSAYYFMSELDGPLYIANISTFSPLSFSGKNDDKYVKIGKDVYLRNVRLSYADASRLRPFDSETRNTDRPKLTPCVKYCAYVWDGKNIYYEGKRLGNADPKNFRLIGYGLISSGRVEASQPEYAKDKKYVYFGDKVVGGADPATFEPIVSGKYYFEFGKDKNNVYFEDKKIDNANPNTFVPLASQVYEGCTTGVYSKDANNVFYKWSIVKDADVNTFEVIKAGNGDFGKDKDSYYHRDKKAKESDFGECQMR